MKSEDHIHFLSDLLHQVNELLTTIREYCDDVVRDDDEKNWQSEGNDQENMPF